MSIKKQINKTITSVVNFFSGNNMAQASVSATGEKLVNKKMSEALIDAGSESIVLLKNENVLPIEKEVVSVFGRSQIDYFYVGYGSGGDVHPPYKVNIIDGLHNEGVKLNEELENIYSSWRNEKDNLPDDGYWGHWPFHYDEMPLNSSIVEDAAKKSDVALIVIGRAAGEDRENKLVKGSFYLTDDEENMLSLVTKAFKKVVVVLDCGNIIDMSWVNKYDVQAVLYAWQLGQEAGNAVARVISGKVNPSGKMPDTIAVNYEDYPSSKYFGNKDYNNYSEDIYVGYRYFESLDKKVLYPFGFGLSYTKFNLEDIAFNYDEKEVKISLKVRNCGEKAGKEVVQVYLNSKLDHLNTPKKVLVGFKKTKLLGVGEAEEIEIKIDKYSLSNFDDSSITGHSGSYVLDSGIYNFFVGEDVRNNFFVGSFEINQVEELVKHNHVLSIHNPFDILKIDEENGKTFERFEKVPVNEVDLKNRILQNLKEEIPENKKELTLDMVKNNKCTLDEFVGSLSNKELEYLSRGAGPMNFKNGTPGNAGCYAGTHKSLVKKGVRPIVTTDGPAGIRIRRYMSLIPCGTAFAASFNEDIVERVYTLISDEMKDNNTDVLLAPGMNIHRNPLCGRNFEYFSEDPLLTGKMAAACVRGIQHNNKSACPKHFICNNQETNRYRNDARVSERALREIYIKPFEICIKESNPKTIMTSYNKVNGVWNHYSYDLIEEVLRKELNFKGVVITDWWMQKSHSQEFPKMRNNAYRVRAGVNVLMPGNMGRISIGYTYDRSLLEGLNKEGHITKSELQQNAKRVLNQVIELDK